MKEKEQPRVCEELNQGGASQDWDKGLSRRDSGLTTKAGNNRH